MKTLDLATKPALAWRLLTAVIATVMMVASGAGVSWGDPVGESAGCWECRAIWYGNGAVAFLSSGARMFRPAPALMDDGVSEARER